MKRLAIIGSNDLAQLIAHHAIRSNWNIAGFFDNKKDVGTTIEPYGKVLGNVDSIENFFEGKGFDFLISGVGYNQFPYRKAVFEKFKNKIPFANVIHKSAFVDDTAILGEGIFILPGCVLDKKVKIDDDVLINTGCTIAHHSTISTHSFIGPGVTIAGKVHIEECCFLGVGCTILDNVNIVAKTLVGGGCVVTKNIKDPGTYAGVPAKKIKENIYFNQ